MSDNFLTFASEDDESMAKKEVRPWKLLVADDETEVHNVTAMVLQNFTFEGTPIEMLHAYSAAEAREILEKEQDISVILLDVVMETDDAGLELARWIRGDLGNRFIRIILRTGQPGRAPENKVITEYDINDYKEKTELTAQKLFTTLTSSIRAYRDLWTIERSRKGLERIVLALPHIFEFKSLRAFAEGALGQLTSLVHFDESSLYIQSSGFAVSEDDDGHYLILAGTGEYQKFVNKPIQEVLPKSDFELIMKSIKTKQSIFEKNVYVGYFSTPNGSIDILYMRGGYALKELDIRLIDMFSRNIAVAFDNIYFNDQIKKTEKEIIYTLGELVESHSEEQGNHVKRVALYSHLIALRAGMTDKEAELLKIASPMHDLGKLRIPTSILRKPDKLNNDEFDLIKKHAEWGAELLNESKDEIMQVAAIIASQHHERWDGTGYPKGLEKEEIHIYGRITAIADVFDILDSKRIYKDAWPFETIIDFFKKERGRQFDPHLIDIFLGSINEIQIIRDQNPDLI